MMCGDVITRVAYLDVGILALGIGLAMAFVEILRIENVSFLCACA